MHAFIYFMMMLYSCTLFYCDVHTVFIMFVSSRASYKFVHRSISKAPGGSLRGMTEAEKATRRVARRKEQRRAKAQLERKRKDDAALAAASVANTGTTRLVRRSRTPAPF